MKTFMDKALAGELADLESALDDAIDEWHSLPLSTESLHSYLGMTREEYSKWMFKPSCIKQIIETRQKCQN